MAVIKVATDNEQDSEFTISELVEFYEENGIILEEGIDPVETARKIYRWLRDRAQ